MNRITTGVIASLLIVVAALANATITDMTKRQRDVAALDAKYTKELADAQTRNTDLQRRLAAGGRRCTVPTWTATTSAQEKLKYLQEYIRTQCLK